MNNELNNQIFTLLGRLALAKSIALGVFIYWQDLLDEHGFGKVKYDQKTLKTIRVTMENLDYAESTIDGVIYDIVAEMFKTDDATANHK